MLHLTHFLSAVFSPSLAIPGPFLLTLVLLSTLAWGQNPPGGGQAKQYPSQEYYLGLTHLENGELEEALAGFREASQRAWRVGNVRFIDSIAPWVMSGECYFQQGNLTQALQQFEAAMTLQIESAGWSVRVNGTGLGGVGANNTTAAMRGIQWGNSQRGATRASLPQFVPVTVGQLDTLEAARRGGVIIPAEVIRIDVSEVLRTLAFAQYRRNQILGSLVPKYPISTNFQTAIQAEPGSGLIWLDSEIRVNQGLAQQGVGDQVNALQTLSTSQSTVDRIDHPLTPVALLAQAELKARESDYVLAAKLLLEGSLSAAQFEQYHLLAEIAARMGAIGCIMGDSGPLNALQGIANWSRRQRRLPMCYALVAASELAANVGNLTASDTLNKTALAATRGRGVLLPRVVAHCAYTAALADFSRGKLAQGNASMLTAMGFYRGSQVTGISSSLQYRLTQTIELHRRDALTVDEARRSLEEILGDDPQVWKMEVLEALTLLQSDQSDAFRLLDELNFRRSSIDEYPMLFDQRSQRRFMSALPWKHRLLVARQIILATEAHLSPAQVQLRRTWIQRIPDIEVLVKRRVDLLAQIAGQSLAWERIEHSKDELLRFKELETLSLRMESMFHVLAMSRLALPESVIGARAIMPSREKLQDQEAILRFVLVPGDEGLRLDAYLVSKASIERFEIGKSLDLERKLLRLLTTLGLGRDKNRKLILDDFKLWQEAAAELRDAMLPESLREALVEYPKLAIVPDGWVWYVPFAMLPMETNDGPRWVEQRELAFAPMVSLAFRCFGAQSRTAWIMEQQRVRPDAKWDGAVWNAAFFGGVDEASEAKKAIEFEDEIPGLKILQPIKEIVPLNLYRVRPGMLLAACRAVEGAAPLDSAWFEQETAKARLTWNDLIASPAVAPEALLVPGWSSAAARLSLGNGDELFLPAMALFICGTQQGLLTRWNGAGTASQSLLKRYLQEWNEHPPSEAWRRSLVALWAEELPPEQEDVLRGAQFAKALMPGAHPLLWSGYIPIGQWIGSEKAN